MENITRFLGINKQITSHKEKFISFLGGVISIYIIFLITNQFFGVEEAVYIIPSMGATAVLLFAAPNAPFSQPWNVFGGHLISAVIGVACYQWISDIHIAAAASVGFAIWAQYYLRCIHPPGGATALAAVIVA
jgi:CBS-domain-containing membrane protein